MKASHYIFTTLSLLFFASFLSAQEAAEASVEEGMFAVVQKIDGPLDEVIVELPNGDIPDAEEGARYPEGTNLSTGDATVILAFGGVVDGVEIQNALMSVRPISDVTLDRFLTTGDSVVTRIKVKSGEIRVKITEERTDYSTDMKIATPNATASVTGTDVSAIGFSSGRGTYVAVASGSISSARDDGTVRGVSGGAFIGAGDDSALDAAMSQASKSNAPIGVASYEVAAGQLSIGGPERQASDLNNSDTNPNGFRGVSEETIREFEEDNGEFREGEPLPSRRR